MVREDVGTLVKLLREERGMSVEELAEAAEMSVDLLQDIEKGVDLGRKLRGKVIAVLTPDPNPTGKLPGVDVEA